MKCEDTEKEGIIRNMLTIHFGDRENEIYFPPAWFDNQYLDEWITDPLSVEMIRDVDQSEVVGAHLIQSPVLGPISPKEISGGVKTLILMAFDRSGKVFNASACGDNCARWIVRIADKKDLTITLHHTMDFSQAGDFSARIENDGKIVHGNDEYLAEAWDLLR